MKHQYVGDINDYVKYGLLRSLSAQGLRVGVCWMLTPNDKRGDGRHLSYLKQPDRFRSADVELFDGLNHIVHLRKMRTTEEIRRADIIPGARYFSSIVPVNADERRAFFHEMWSALRSCDVLFFDPDNGIEVASVREGKKGSERYVFWKEIAGVLKEKRGIVIYQHFPRVERKQYMRSRLREAERKLKITNVYAVATSHIMLLLAVPPRLRPALRASLQRMRRDWKPHLLK